MTDTQDEVRAAVERLAEDAQMNKHVLAVHTSDLRTLLASYAALVARVEVLEKVAAPEWFYPADGYDGEQCCFSVDEVLEEHYFWDRQKTGTHVVEINVAARLPSIWAAVRFQCDCEEADDCDCDNEMIVTEHATEEAARAALTDAANEREGE